MIYTICLFLLTWRDEAIDEPFFSCEKNYELCEVQLHSNLVISS